MVNSEGAAEREMNSHGMHGIGCCNETDGRRGTTKDAVHVPGSPVHPCKRENQNGPKYEESSKADRVKTERAFPEPARQQSGMKFKAPAKPDIKLMDDRVQQDQPYPLPA